MRQTIRRSSALFCLAALAASCTFPDGSGRSTSTGSPAQSLTFDQIAQAVPGSVVLTGGDSAKNAMKVLVSPAHQGRIFTMQVGSVESTGLVNLDAIRAGETSTQFNNFGGLDRFWLGPEAGQFGLYFEPGAELTRDVWRVPADFDRGPFRVVSSDASRVVMTRDIEVTNYSGTRFRVRVEALPYQGE